MRSSGHWLCLHIVEEGVLPYSCFVLHSPPTPFLLVAGVRKKHLSCILEGLSLALECAGWQDMGLTGHHVDSLLDLLINQHSQVSVHHSIIRPDQKIHRPLTVHSVPTLQVSEKPDINFYCSLASPGVFLNLSSVFLPAHIMLHCKLTLVSNCYHSVKPQAEQLCN